MLKIQLLGAESTALTWASKVTVKWVEKLPKSRTGSEQKHLNNPQEAFTEDLLQSFPFMMTKLDVRDTPNWKTITVLSNTYPVTDYNCPTDSDFVYCF